MVDRTFRELLDGKIEYLMIAVCPGTTRAKREEPNVGLWKLSREQFQVIVASIRAGEIAAQKQGSQFPPRHLKKIADECDDQGIESRWFRLNEQVAQWIDDNEPTAIELDYILM